MFCLTKCLPRQMQDKVSLTLLVLRCRTTLMISWVAMENKTQHKTLWAEQSCPHHYSFPVTQVSECKAGKPDAAASSLSPSQTRPTALPVAMLVWNSIQSFKTKISKSNAIPESLGKTWITATASKQKPQKFCLHPSSHTTHKPQWCTQSLGHRPTKLLSTCQVPVNVTFSTFKHIHTKNFSGVSFCHSLLPQCKY